MRTIFTSILWEISVALTDTTGLPSEVMSELKREVEAIYATASVQIQWSSEGSLGLAEHTARVYLLHRLPAMLETRLRAFRRERPMAAAFGERGSVTAQAIYVSRSAVCASATPGTPDSLSSEDLATALGRVVAHELAHRFVSREHAPRGILKAALRGSELTGPAGGPHFTDEEVRLLREMARPVSATGGPSFPGAVSPPYRR